MKSKKAKDRVAVYVIKARKKGARLVDKRIKGKTEKVPVPYPWGNWTGNFDDPDVAEAHLKHVFSDSYWTDQYEFGLFAKDSEEMIELVRLIELGE